MFAAQKFGFVEFGYQLEIDFFHVKTTLILLNLLRSSTIFD